MTLVSLVPPYLTGYLIDRVLRPFEDGALSFGEARHVAWLTLGALIVVFSLREFFAWVRLRTMAVLGEQVAKDLRTELYAHVHQLSVSYFSSKQTGSIISRVSSDTDRIWDFIAFGVVEVSLSLLMLLGLGGVLISLDWQLGLAMTLPVPLLLWFILKNGRSMQRLFLRAWRKWSNLTDVLSDTIPGIRVVKAFDQSEHEKRRFGQRNSTVTREFIDIHHVWTSFWPLLMLMLHFVIVLVWAMALPRLIPAADARDGLTTGVFVSFMLYVGMFTQPIETFGQLSRMLNRALSSAHRIFELLDTEPPTESPSEAVRLEPLRGEVEFRNVTFGYDTVREILKGVSFKANAGEMVGFVGPSGAGKTTIINLIAKFYEPDGGEILVDGVEIRKLDVGHYRRQIGMVLQDPFLFHGSILDNIRYGMPEASLGQVIGAARAANAHDFICKLPHAYDTVVGERGHTLSGGERQRVSIARAVLHNPRILIMDEATSSVDTETEHKIQEALDRLVSGRTVFAIAHRLSTLTRASRLFVVKDGRIVEQGTHAELLAIEDGLYRKLERMQRELHEMYAV
jgi:ATP-binding cassette, subfamily B, bacterial